MIKLIKKFLLNRKLKKEYEKKIMEHKTKLFQLFYDLLSWKDCEWITKDPFVLKELWYRILEHDDSLYEKIEMNAFKTTNCDKEIYDAAVQHHIENNDHHWENRVNDEFLTFQIKLACVENLLDWMSYKTAPYEEWFTLIENTKLPETQKNFMKEFMWIIINNKTEVYKNDISKEEE